MPDLRKGADDAQQPAQRSNGERIHKSHWRVYFHIAHPADLLGFLLLEVCFSISFKFRNVHIPHLAFRTAGKKSVILPERPAAGGLFTPGRCQLRFPRVLYEALKIFVQVCFQRPLHVVCAIIGLAVCYILYSTGIDRVSRKTLKKSFDYLSAENPGCYVYYGKKPHYCNKRAFSGRPIFTPILTKNVDLGKLGNTQHVVLKDFF